MKLYLVQHGDALSEEADPERPLSRQGREDVRRIATFLRGRVQPSRVCHSGKTRARQTAEVFAGVLAPDRTVEALSGIGPRDAVVPLAAEVADLGDETLVVGHLPFLAKLATLLVAGREGPAVVDYRPGSILCVASGSDGRWAIQWMVRPELLGG